MDKNTEKPDEQLGYLLTQASFLKQRITNAALKEIDLTYAQFIILAGIFELREESKIVTQQLVASERRQDKAMVSNVVKTLIERKLVSRDEHPEDKRAFTLSLTRTGEEKAIEGRKIAWEIDKTFFAGINQQKLREMLKKLLMNDPTNYDK